MPAHGRVKLRTPSLWGCDIFYSAASAPCLRPSPQIHRHNKSTEKPPVRKTSDTRDRVDESLRYLLPQDSNVPYDMKHVVSKVR